MSTEDTLEDDFREEIAHHPWRREGLGLVGGGRDFETAEKTSLVSKKTATFGKKMSFLGKFPDKHWVF